MELIQIYVQIESARETVDELGKLGLIQFRDLNPEVNAFSRNFVNEVKRFDEMERKIRYFQEQVDRIKPDLPQLLGIHVEPVRADVPARIVIDDLEAKFEELEKEIIQMTQNQETLDRNFNELIEFKHVLQKDAVFFDESGEITVSVPSEDSSLIEMGLAPTKAVNLGFLTGVIPREKVRGFERVLWRATRGNVFFKSTIIEEKLKDPTTGETVEKNVFIVFFQGERIQSKVRKICESFGATIYPCPETPAKRLDLRDQIQKRLDDLRAILERTKEHSIRILSKVAANIEGWRELVIKEKSIYHTMNLFNYDVGRKCLIAEGWVPSAHLEDIRAALRTASQHAGSLVPSILQVVQTRDSPPTYFKTTALTRPFQDIVESYGVARYREVNPAVFTVITFPFLFAVMFGDFGHGMVLTIVGALMLIYQKRLEAAGLSEMAKTMFDGRYVIFLMGLFSMYVGLIYNETFAIPINLFGTRWNLEHNEHGEEEYVWKMGTPPYPFGVDPKWKEAGNDLTYYNSLKMKLSIIFGVTQMCLGIVMSAFNFVHFKKRLEFYFEFIPQLIFMLSIFGYMCFLIFLKWNTDFLTSPPPTLEGAAAPSILNLMIQMFLSPTPSNFKPAFHLYGGQPGLQLILLLLALASVPIMLLVKPLYLKKQHEKSSHERLLDGPGDAQPPAEAGHGGGHGGHGDHFEFSEVMVHQCIHTIEFVLGSISNTASYLRLWALSLAHAELSKVFWEMILLNGMSSTSMGGGQVIMLFICFAVWTALTVGVLLMMESLSAFLHALRLHWVEFQNKFYGGDGYSFAPFSYEVIIAEHKVAAAEAAALAAQGKE